MTTILIKKKDTAGAPTAGDLTNAAGGTEIAVNTATKRIYTKDSGGNVVELGTNPSTIDATTVDTTNLEVTNIKAKDGTASIVLADTTGIATFSNATVISTTDNTNAALRITQLGTGNALLVEDSTNPDSTPTVITAAGDVGIGTTNIVGSALGTNGKALSLSIESDINGNSTSGSITAGTKLISFSGIAGPSNYTAASLALHQTGSVEGVGDFRFSTGDGAGALTERIRLNSSGSLLLGLTSSRTNNLSSASLLQLEAVNSAATGALVRNSADTSGAGLILGKSRGTSVGSFTAVVSGDRLGTLSFSGTDGTTMLSAATILSEVDGTPGTNDMPGRLVFSTTADGASSPTERMRITSAGNLLMATSGEVQFYDNTYGIRASTGLEIKTGDFTRFLKGTTENMRIDTSGNVGIGTSAPSVKLEVAGSITSFSTTTLPAIMALSSQAAGFTPPNIQMRRTGASNTTTPDSQRLGEIRFDGLSVGAVYDNAAFIAVDGGVNASGGIPSTMTFGTATSGANAVERMRIDTSGNVGIGTTTPTGRLHVRWDAGAGDGYTGKSIFSTTDQALFIKTYWQSGTGQHTTLEASNLANSALTDLRLNGATLQFLTGSTERMRIDSSGNLLVGTTGQITSSKLNIYSGATNATTYNTASFQGGSVLTVQNQQTTSVSTSAVTIGNTGIYATLALVYGSDGTNRFQDLIMCGLGTGTINVINSFTVGGSPSSRTYSQTSSTYRLAMGSGTYTVQFSGLSQGD